MKAILFIAVLFFVTKTFSQSPDSASAISSSLTSNIDTANKKIFLCSPSRQSIINQPLIVVDGKLRDSIYLKSLDPSFIRYIAVLKGDAAVKKYGKKATNGVIIVRTKRDPILQP